MLALQRSMIPVRTLAKGIGGWHESGGLAAQGVDKTKGTEQEGGGQLAAAAAGLRTPIVGKGKLGGQLQLHRLCGTCRVSQAGGPAAAFADW